MSSLSVRAVLFDLGGVLVELGPLDELFNTEIDSDDFWRHWLSSPSVRSFERGGCTAEEFGAGLKRELDLNLSGEEIVERFRRFPRGLFAGAENLVRAVAPELTVGVLSNTNAMHWHDQADAETITGLFDRRFLSYELGMVKPDAELFHHVVAALGYEPAEVVFVDDNQLNVDGARAVGIDAHRTRGIDEARTVLAGRGVLRAA